MRVRPRASATPRRASTTVRSRTLIAVTASVAMIAAGTGTAAASTAGPASSGGKTSNVIVVLRNQHTDLKLGRGKAASPRTNAYHTDQTAVIGKAKTAGATNLHGFSTINAVAATVTPAQSAALAANPAVAAVYPDLPLKGAPVVTDTGSAPASGGSPTVADPTICPTDPSKPLLEPEALQVTNTAFSDTSTPQAQKIVDGTGIKVAFIADGLDIDNPDFIRANGQHVFVDAQDFSGEGWDAPSDAAEAFGDASAIAAQGRQTYDLSSYVNPLHPLPAGCNITVRGMAPGASLIGLKVFGNTNSAPTSRFIEAIDYAVQANVDVLNESFGGNPYPDNGDDPITLADAAAIAAGVTVVSSTGDAGVTGTVGSPASSNVGVIGVAATTTYQSYMQEGYAGVGLSNGTWLDNNISGLSSGGLTQANRTPDLAAPGDLGWALCTPDDTIYEGCTDDNGDASSIQNFGGTSQSSPLTAGAAALVIEAYAKTHGGHKPTPAVVKKILTSTATDLGHPAYEQGSGLLNSLKAVQAAESWKDANGSPKASGSALVVDQTQLSSAGAPGQAVRAYDTVTNVGTKAQRVTVTTRALTKTVADTSGSVAMNANTGPTFLDSTGIPRSYVSFTFNVKNNVDRATVSAAVALPQGFAPRIILISPSGVYSYYSIPQGAANYALAEVRYPEAGTWTAYLGASQSSGFVGNWNWRVQQQDYAPSGWVFPSVFTLAPGASMKVTVLNNQPSQPGDLSSSVQFSGSTSGVTSVPFSLRAVAPPKNNDFTGTITGGNGRGYVGQAEIYYLDVPKGQKNLGVGIQLADADNGVLASLTAPNGQSYSFNSNIGNSKSDGSAIQDYVDNPMAGRWVLSLQVLTPVSGELTSSAFRVKIRYNSVSIKAPKLPTSTATKLAKGKTVTVPVSVTNTGVAPLTYFTDARLNTTGTLALANINTDDTIALPQDETPVWFVPTHVTSFSVQAAADQLVNLDMAWNGGDPEVYAGTDGIHNTTTDTVTSSQVSPGIWYANIGQTGPFNGPANPGQVTLSAWATGQLFDLDIDSTAGDVVGEGVLAQSATSPVNLKAAVKKMLAGEGNSTAPATSTAVIDGPPTLAPGQSATINVTITPSRAKGTKVTGHLYINTFDSFNSNADELIDLPYAYTVG